MIQIKNIKAFDTSQNVLWVHSISSFTFQTFSNLAATLLVNKIIMGALISECRPNKSAVVTALIDCFINDRVDTSSLRMSVKDIISHWYGQNLRLNQMTGIVVRDSLNDRSGLRLRHGDDLHLRLIHLRVRIRLNNHILGHHSMTRFCLLFLQFSLNLQFFLFFLLQVNLLF